MDMDNLIYWLMLAAVFAGLWKIYEKADEEGWKALVPIYGLYVWLRLIERPWWWLLLLLIPLVNFVVYVMMTIDLSRAFSKGVGFMLGMIFLPVIFLPLLGFSEAQFAKPRRA